MRETPSEAARAKLSQTGFSVTIRLVSSGDRETARKGLAELGSSFFQFNIAELNGFILGRIYQHTPKILREAISRTIKFPMILSLEELSGILALPGEDVKIPELYLLLIVENSYNWERFKGSYLSMPSSSSLSRGWV